MEDLMIETISKFEFESEHVILQSFSTQSLLYLSQELKTDLRLIQLTKIPITDDQLKQLKMAGAYGIGPDKALIIERGDTNHRTGYSDLVKRAHETISRSMCTCRGTKISFCFLIMVPM